MTKCVEYGIILDVDGKQLHNAKGVIKMEFDNLISVLQEFGIDVTSTKVVINWVQLTVVVFALFSMFLMLKTVWKECSTRVKILAGLCTASVLLIKCNEYLNTLFKAKELLKYSTYTLFASIGVVVAMLLFYKFYGVSKKKSEIAEELTPVQDDGFLSGIGDTETSDFDIDNTDFDLEV